MADISHAIYIDAPPSRVFRALTKVDELSRWWCSCSGDAKEGGELMFVANRTARATMSVQKLVLDKLVTWKCTEHDFRGDNDWLSTSVEFVLWPKEAGTQLVFTHSGLEHETGTFSYCDAGWLHYLKRLKSLVERGFADYTASHLSCRSHKLHRANEAGYVMEG